MQMQLIRARPEFQDFHIPNRRFREAQLAFTRGELRRMVLKDKLGQTVRLDFLTGSRNVPVPDAEVQFSPPAGADLIGTPVP